MSEVEALKQRVAELERERAEARTDCKSWQRAAESIQDEARRLREALKHYANPKNWSCLRCVELCSEHTNDHDFSAYEYEDDGPAVAFAALAASPDTEQPR